MNSRLLTRCDQPLRSVCSGHKEPPTAPSSTSESTLPSKFLPSALQSYLAISPFSLPTSGEIHSYFHHPIIKPQTLFCAVNPSHLSTSFSHNQTSHRFYFQNKIHWSQQHLSVSCLSPLYRNLYIILLALTSRSNYQKRGRKPKHNEKTYRLKFPKSFI